MGTLHYLNNLRMNYFRWYQANIFKDRFCLLLGAENGLAILGVSESNQEVVVPSSVLYCSHQLSTGFITANSEVCRDFVLAEKNQGNCEPNHRYEL